MAAYVSHLLCDLCWDEREQGARIPFRLKGAPRASCCKCGRPTSSGIYVRDKVAGYLCEGKCDPD